MFLASNWSDIFVDYSMYFSPPTSTPSLTAILFILATSWIRAITNPGHEWSQIHVCESLIILAAQMTVGNVSLGKRHEKFHAWSWASNTTWSLPHVPELSTVSRDRQKTAEANLLPSWEFLIFGLYQRAGMSFLLLNPNSDHISSIYGTACLDITCDSHHAFQHY